MGTTVIQVEQVYKRYKLGVVSTGTISHDLNRWWHSVRGKEDPYLKVTGNNNRAIKDNNEYVWALQDINFKVEQGEALGIIGRNGAGKSTLLKILSKVTGPTQGKIKLNGRIASLLEVGTGFNPELTGRENIFLNGAIMGMPMREVKAKFDEIVDFSGVEKYIDTPVKRYSSGMYVRLAFAVAAHLEPDILVVDEVLAVGDAEFQKKCLGKMQDVSASTGRTVLFVSHNMVAVKSLCKNALYLQNGQVVMQGEAETVMNAYLGHVSKTAVKCFDPTDFKSFNNEVRLIEVGKESDKEGGEFHIEEPLNLYLEFDNINVDTPINVNFFLNTLDGVVVLASVSTKIVLNKGRCYAKCTIAADHLNDMSYSVDLMVVTNARIILTYKDALFIEGIEKTKRTGWLGKIPGVVRPKYEWTLENKQ